METKFIQESTLTSIANAIRAKKGSSALIPVTNFASEIGSITFDSVNLMDIGLYHYSQSGGYLDFTHLSSVSKDGSSYDRRVLRQNGANNCSVIIKDANSYFVRGNYTKLCVDCQVIYNSTAYNTSRIGVRRVSNGQISSNIDQPDNDASVYLVNYRTQTNYDGTSPWYNLSRQVVEVDISALEEDEEFWICLQNCDNATDIYGIWFE